MTDTNGIEYTTMHDYKPTHPPVSKAVMVAKEHRDIAKKEYNDYINWMLNNGIPGIEWTETEYLAKRANDADDALKKARNIALNECSCTPDLPDGRTGHVCAVCLNRRSDSIPYSATQDGE